MHNHNTTYFSPSDSFALGVPEPHNPVDRFRSSPPPSGSSLITQPPQQKGPLLYIGSVLWVSSKPFLINDWTWKLLSCVIIQKCQKWVITSGSLSHCFWNRWDPPQGGGKWSCIWQHTIVLFCYITFSLFDLFVFSLELNSHTFSYSLTCHCPVLCFLLQRAAEFSFKPLKLRRYCFYS